MLEQSIHFWKDINEHPNANAMQSQEIRLRVRASRKDKNECLPASTFQRDTAQTNSMQEEARGNDVV